MDYAAYYRKADKADWQAYYDAVAEKTPTDPQATARTRDAEDTIPCEARNVMFNIAAEIKTPSTSSARRCPRCSKVAPWSTSAAEAAVTRISPPSSSGRTAR